ncbi:hypothetical protein NIES4102_22860 [Chondrocystis sp. NIES-4102]|nr:hypothetical protein NIES4102_22860 [Chondrocystis sp. NIES-4102]
MQLPALHYPQQKLTCPQLPLAVYREVVAHLRQVEGVDAKIILRPHYHDSTQFDYYQSQVAAIEINYSENLDDRKRKQVTAILDFYAQRYQPWQEY